MTCLEFRRLSVAKPHNSDLAFHRHARECDGCAAHYREVLAFERELVAAVTVPIADATLARFNPGPAAVPGRSRVPAYAGALMFAASLLLGVFAAQSPTETLADVAIEHVIHEADLLWLEGPVDPEQTDAVLAAIGAKWTAQPARIAYSGNCDVAGTRGAHLVVRTSTGPVARILIPQASELAHASHEGFWSAVVPKAGGAVAVVALTPLGEDAVRALVAGIEFCGV